MATVRLSFSPSPAHVRTARLVGIAVARRAGVADATLDEVRLAIGEACSRAVALHRRHALSALIEVEIHDEDHFTVRVTDRAPLDDPPAGQADLETFSEEDAAVGMGLTLLEGLVDDLSVRPAAIGTGTEVEMSWPTGPHQ
ncbi:MAG TPA: ATP-binding protein [Micromonosporaceae bacterium]|jgi:anti-sigma regulatory factor (Ser/Thr protein kinase)